MYRSFLTCDDPKGVVECGTIRKHRNSSQKMENKTKSRRTAKNLETSLTNKSDKEKIVPRESAEKYSDPSSTLQLMEVSRGAQRLNNTVDSWSRGPTYDRGSEDIAKDLLKGALDLQESLVVLRNFQAASWHMARLKKKRNEKAETSRINTNMTDRTQTDQYSDKKFSVEFHKTWPSVDVSSGNCTEELKRVLRDSLVRKNPLPSTSTEGLDSASELPSASSSQSSGIHTNRLSDSSISSAASMKERGPNLVAMLMGLEEFHSRPFPAATQKQLEGEKILNQKRPIFEIDVPKVRKINPIAENVDLERKKSLREILETTHFKGILKKSSVGVPKVQIHHFNDPRTKQCDDLPPIVLMKPRYKQLKSHMPVPPDKSPLGKLKAEIASSKTIKHKEGSTKMGKKGENVATKRITQEEERTKQLKEVVKLDEKEIKPIEHFPNKAKVYSHVSHKPHASETTDDKSQVKTISRKSPDKEVSKPRIVSKSQDQGESTSTNLRKPQSGSRINKNDIYTQQSTALNPISKKVQKFNNSKDRRKNQMKKQRPGAEPETAKPFAEQLGPGEEEKIIDVPCLDDCTEIRTITTLADELPHSLTNKITEDCKQIQSSSCDIMLLKSDPERDATSAEEAHDCANCSEMGSELKYLLFTSQSFIGHAAELLNLDVDCPMTLQQYETNGIANPGLYLDCANEITERKSLQESQIVRLLLPTCAGNSRLHISLGRLVEEIYNAIENLKFYCEISRQKLSVDSVYAMMERDIKCNGLINGMWDWGWKHGFSADEAEQVVNEIEGLVLSGLIEEVITNL